MNKETKQVRGVTNNMLKCPKDQKWISRIECIQCKSYCGEVFGVKAIYCNYEKGSDEC